MEDELEKLMVERMLGWGSEKNQKKTKQKVTPDIKNGKRLVFMLFKKTVLRNSDQQEEELAN